HLGLERDGAGHPPALLRAPSRLSALAPAGSGAGRGGPAPGPGRQLPDRWGQPGPGRALHPGRPPGSPGRLPDLGLLGGGRGAAGPPRSLDVFLCGLRLGGAGAGPGGVGPGLPPGGLSAPGVVDLWGSGRRPHSAWAHPLPLGPRLRARRLHRGGHLGRTGGRHLRGLALLGRGARPPPGGGRRLDPRGCGVVSIEGVLGAGGPKGFGPGRARSSFRAGAGREVMVTRRRGWLVIFLSFSLVLPGSRALAQELSLEAAEQLRAQVFQALEPAPAWEGWVRLAPDQEPARVTALGLRRLRIDAPGEPGPLHVWTEGWTCVGTAREGWLGPSPALVTLSQSTLPAFLCVGPLARAPLVGVTVEGAGGALELHDRELGRVWVEVEGARPARIWAEDETVLWELEPAPEAALHASLHLPGGPHLRLVLEPLETGWVSRAADGPEWVGRRAVDPPEEAFFRPGRLGQLLAALDRYEAASAEGQRAEARRALREAIRLAPNRTALYTELGVLELRAGNWQGALAAFDQAFQLDPDDPLLANNL